jgi:hypothetical protein
VKRQGPFDSFTFSGYNLEVRGWGNKSKKTVVMWGSLWVYLTLCDEYADACDVYILKMLRSVAFYVI